jgi:nitrogenase subunit NifH
VVYFVPSKNLPRTRLGRELPEVLAGVELEFGTGVLPSVSQRIAVAEAVLSGQTIDEYEPDGEAVKEFPALADAVEALPP